jgi:hypothetical protein
MRMLMMMVVVVVLVMSMTWANTMMFTCAAFN